MILRRRRDHDEAVRLNEAGMAAWRGGDYRSAAGLLEAALNLLDPSNAKVAILRSTVLNNLGLVASKRGDPRQALDRFQESLRAGEAGGGLSDRDRAFTLDNMANEEIELGQRAGPYWFDNAYVNAPTVEHLNRAEEYLGESRALFVRHLPHSRDDLLVNLGHAIDIRRIARDIDGALELSAEGVDLLALAPVELDVAWDTVAVHADLLCESGKVDDAAEAVRPLVDADREHPVSSDSRVCGLATATRILALAGDVDRLEYCAQRTAEIDDALAGVWLAGASEEAARRQFARVNRRTEQVLGSLLRTSSEGELPAWAYQAVLRRKGLLAHRLERAWMHARATPALAPVLDEVRALRKQVVAVDLGDHDVPTIRAARARHEQLQRQRNAAESALFATVDAELGPVPPPSLADLQDSLPADSVFLDLVLVEAPESGAHRSYVAVLVRPDSAPTYVVLGRMAEIDDAVLELVDELARPPGGDETRRVELLDRGIRALSVWSSRTALPRQVIVAPTGLWARVPLGLLEDDSGAPLLEHHVLHTVPSGRWWVTHRSHLASEAPADGPSYVVGDPDFDDGLTKRLEDLDFMLRMRVDRLQHSAAEARVVAERLGTEPVLDRHATRTSLLTVVRPRVLHLATHGVFIQAIGSFDEQREPRYSVTERVGGVVVTRPIDLPTDRPAVSELRERHRQRAQWLSIVGPADQLSRSALLLAGFNAWVAGVGEESGLVSAAELEMMDLRGTELVVLSACQSGLGAVDYSDGSVIGIRTACLVAGANACVSSLWEVLDNTTAQLMDDYYATVLAGSGRAEALRKAQLRLRAARSDPYYWAAWTLEGDPDAMRGNAAVDRSS